MYLLAIDQGTTSTRAIIFNEKGLPLSTSQQELTQYFPQEGWVEHNPEQIWQHTVEMCRNVIQQLSLTSDKIAGIGITNQRETTIIWHRKTGKPIYSAIVWQDRRTAEFCGELVAKGCENIIHKKTGLLIDPYFSASKIHWILKNVPEARQLAEQGQLAFGTIDSYLLWHLTGGKAHATDATNAARTLLFNIHTQQWDNELLDLFAIPSSLLPEVKDSSGCFGHTIPELFGTSLPIMAILGDQQAAMVGQACFNEGMAKSTYGTGCFMMMHTGHKVVDSKNKLLSTVAYRLNNKPSYALEGSIFVAGAAVQWLRDTVQLIHSASETENLAHTVPNTEGVYLVPAFTGLGAPYWDPLARGAILGLTRNSGVAHIVRAALESVCYQSRDLLTAMMQDGAPQLMELRVDGGMVVNDWLMQFLADMLGIPVQRPKVTETTALGAALFAGLALGFYNSLDDIAKLWQAQQQFSPQKDKQEAQKLYDGWLKAVKRNRS